MSDQLTEIVGQDVNLEATEAEQPVQVEEQVSAPAEETQAEPEQRQERVVPLAALHEERQRRQQLSQEMAKLRADQAERDRILEERFAALARITEPQPPSFEENPALALQHQIREVQESTQHSQQQMQAWQQQQQQQQQLKQIETVVTTSEAQFVQKQPDYLDAVNHLKSQRIAELMADGAEDIQAAQIAQQELVQFAIQRAAQGRNPAEAAYAIAKARGYAPKAAAQQTPEQRIASQQKGVSAAKSLGSGGGGGNKITAETLASMSNEEFAELTKGNNWQKIMGG